MHGTGAERPQLASSRPSSDPQNQPPNQQRCNTYKRKELQSQAHIIDGLHQPSGIAARRLLYWSIRGLPLKTPGVRVAQIPN